MRVVEVLVRMEMRRVDVRLQPLEAHDRQPQQALLERAALVRGLVHRLVDRRDPRQGDRRVQVGLVREVVVQRRLGDARRPRDIGHRDVAEALRRRTARRRRDDPVAAAAATLASRGLGDAAGMAAAGARGSIDGLGVDTERGLAYTTYRPVSKSCDPAAAPKVTDRPVSSSRHPGDTHSMDPIIRVEHLTKRYKKSAHAGRRRHQLRRRRGRAVRLPRPQRRRQDHHDLDPHHDPGQDQRHRRPSPATTSTATPRRSAASIGIIFQNPTRRPPPVGRGEHPPPRRPVRDLRLPPVLPADAGRVPPAGRAARPGGRARGEPVQAAAAPTRAA